MEANDCEEPIGAEIPLKCSPVFQLANEIAQAPFRAAPEKAASLKDMTAGVYVKFLLTDSRFVFDVSGKEIRVSTGALNLLWAASYAYWLIYQGYRSAQQNGCTEYNPSMDAVASEALRLYEWSLNAAMGSKFELWPSTLPHPQPNPVPESLLAVANELFLVAVAWIFLHEVGHVTYDHTAEPIGPRALQEEQEADKFASDWLLNGLSDEALIQKRSLGIAAANVVLVALDLGVGTFHSKTHPPSYERAHRNLRFRQLEEEHMVHAFMTVLLQFHLTVFEREHQLSPDAPFHGMFDDLCFQLGRNQKPR